MNIADHTYLFTITDRFAIEGRGVVVVPGIPWTEGTPVVRKGAPLVLRTPLGDIIETTLQDIEMISYRPGVQRLQATPFSLPKTLHKFDIPIGTEVYLHSSASSKSNSEQAVHGNTLSHEKMKFASLLPPTEIDGARVIEWAWSGDIPFGEVPGTTSPEIFGLAIATYDDERFYRFSCDRNWETQQDECYDSFIDAKQQLPDQYRSVEVNWIKA